MGLGALLAPPPPRVRAVAQPTPAGNTVARQDDAELRAAGSTYEAILLDFRNRYGFNPTQTYRGFMGVPGAWRASVMLSDLYAQIPFRSFRTDPVTLGDVPTPRNAALLDDPSAGFEDPAVVWASWGLDYLWDGNMVGIYTGFNPVTARPTAILPVPVTQVGVGYDFSTANGPLGELAARKVYDINGVQFDESRIFHVKGPCAPGSLRGLGVLETQLSGLNLATDLERQAQGISLNGVPTGVLKSLNPEAAPADLAAAKAKWIESQRTRTVAALGPSIDFEPLSWNPEEMQLIEARKFSLTQLELMFGLPVGWLGGSTPNKSYANVEQDAVNLVKFSALSGMVMRTESVLTRKTLPRGQRAIGNLDAVLRSDTMNRYKAHQLALGNKPWKTVNEVRAIENLPPIEGGDELPAATSPAPADGNTIDGEVVADPQAITSSPEGGTQ